LCSLLDYSLIFACLCRSKHTVVGAPCGLPVHQLSNWANAKFDRLGSSASNLPAVNVGSQMNMNGWNFSVQENSNSWFGAIVDFSGGYASKNLTLPHAGGAPVAANFTPALFTMGGGPQFSYRKSDRVQPFCPIHLCPLPIPT
jgi:hypothetical protein